LDCDLQPHGEGQCRCTRCGEVIAEEDCDGVYMMCSKPAGGLPARRKRRRKCKNIVSVVPVRLETCEYHKCKTPVFECKLYGDCTSFRELPLVPCCRVCDDYEAKSSRSFDRPSSTKGQ